MLDSFYSGSHFGPASNGADCVDGISMGVAAVGLEPTNPG